MPGLSGDHAGGQRWAGRLRADVSAASADRRRAGARAAPRLRAGADGGRISRSSGWRRTRRCPTRCSSRTWRLCSTSSPSSPIPAPSRAGTRCRRSPPRSPRIVRCTRFSRRRRSTAATCWSPAARVCRPFDADQRCRRASDAPAARAVRLHGRPDRGARLPAPQVGGHHARRATAAREPVVDRRRGVRRVHARRDRAGRTVGGQRAAARGSGHRRRRRFRAPPIASPRSACGWSAWTRASSRRRKAR